MTATTGYIFGTIKNTDQTWLVDANFEFGVVLDVSAQDSGENDPAFDVNGLFQQFDTERWGGWYWNRSSAGSDARLMNLYGQVAGDPFEGYIDGNGALRTSDGTQVTGKLVTGDNLRGHIVTQFSND